MNISELAWLERAQKIIAEAIRQNFFTFYEWSEGAAEEPWGDLKSVSSSRLEHNGASFNFRQGVGLASNNVEILAGSNGESLLTFIIRQDTIDQYLAEEAFYQGKLLFIFKKAIEDGRLILDKDYNVVANRPGEIFALDPETPNDPKRDYPEHNRYFLSHSFEHHQPWEMVLRQKHIYQTYELLIDLRKLRPLLPKQNTGTLFLVAREAYMRGFFSFFEDGYIQVLNKNPFEVDSKTYVLDSFSPGFSDKNRQRLKIKEVVEKDIGFFNSNILRERVRDTADEHNNAVAMQVVSEAIHLRQLEISPSGEIIKLEATPFVFKGATVCVYALPNLSRTEVNVLIMEDKLTQIPVRLSEFLENVNKGLI